MRRKLHGIGLAPGFNRRISERKIGQDLNSRIKKYVGEPSQSNSNSDGSGRSETKKKLRGFGNHR